MAALVWARSEGGREHRRVVGPAPFGHLGVKASDVQNVSRFGNRMERAGFLFMFIEVQVRVGNSLPDAKHQPDKQCPLLQQAVRSQWCARHAFHIAGADDVAVMFGE